MIEYSSTYILLWADAWLAKFYIYFIFVSKLTPGKISIIVPISFIMIENYFYKFDFPDGSLISEFFQFRPAQAVWPHLLCFAAALVTWVRQKSSYL